MNSLFSTVSGYFSKSLVLGAFLPSVIFITFLGILVVPLLPPDIELVNNLKALDIEWKALTITFVVIVLSGLLYNLNTPHIRVYEGYPWKETWFGKKLTALKKQKFKELTALQRGMRALVLSMKDTGAPDKTRIIGVVGSHVGHLPASLQKLIYSSEFQKLSDSEKWDQWYSEVLRKWADLNRRVLKEFPVKDSLILPTRLGNVIRSFEYYPDREYGIDAITLFPRLVAKIDKDYAAVMDDAKTSLDFMMNCVTLSLLLAFSLLMAGLAVSTPLKSTYSLLTWGGEIAVILVIAYLSYVSAIDRAAAWGATVKSAFDLYREALLTQLGYSQTPKNKKDERILWDKISRQMLDGDSLKGPRIEYEKRSSPSVAVEGLPAGDSLKILREARQMRKDNFLEIYLTVSNTGDLPVKDVSMTDTVPENWLFHADSTQLTDIDKKLLLPPAAVRGTNPYSFSVGDLAAGQKKIVIYEIFTRR